MLVLYRRKFTYCLTFSQLGDFQMKIIFLALQRTKVLCISSERQILSLFCAFYYLLACRIKMGLRQYSNFNKYLRLYFQQNNASVCTLLQVCKVLAKSLLLKFSCTRSMHGPIKFKVHYTIIHFGPGPVTHLSNLGYKLFQDLILITLGKSAPFITARF